MIFAFYSFLILMYNVVSSSSYTLCCGFFWFSLFFLHRDRWFEQNVFSNPCRRGFFFSAPYMWAARTTLCHRSRISTVLESFYCLLSWDLSGHQDLFSACGKFIKKLSKIHLASASKQIGEDKVLIVCSFGLKQNSRSSCGTEGTQVLCECGGSTVLWRELCETGEFWLQTDCAQNQFLLCHFSFASFVHPVVLHTQFMARYHQPWHCSDDILC